MKYYTSTIPLPLAEKLKEKGMPIVLGKRYANICPNTEDDKMPYQILCSTTYAEVIDWFMSKECEICIKIAMYSPTKFDWAVTSHSHWGNFSGVTYPSWHEAAEAAIEKALTLI